MDLIEKDSDAFDVVMGTFKLPEETAAEKKKKEAATQKATIEAAKVPLKTMQHSFNALTHARAAAEKGNINAITDAGVAAHALMAAMEGAALNVRINLGNITDKSFTDKTAKAVEKLLADGANLKGEVLEIVEARMRELTESN
jgi:formiminotetrahydrofolate cyclodeaminase